jgi:hypothetical protein
MVVSEEGGPMMDKIWIGQLTNELLFLKDFSPTVCVCGWRAGWENV